MEALRYCSPGMDPLDRHRSRLRVRGKPMARQMMQEGQGRQCLRTAG